MAKYILSFTRTVVEEREVIVEADSADDVMKKYSLGQTDNGQCVDSDIILENNISIKKVH